MNNHHAPDTVDSRRTGPLLAVGLLVVFVALASGGCVAASTSSGTAAPAGASGLGSSPTDASPAGESPAAIVAPSEGPLATAGGAIVLTMANDGKTIHLAVGQRFTVALGGTVNWSVKVADPAIVQAVTGAATPTGVQGVYEARAAGSTLLNAIGAPQCTSGTCAQFRIVFSVTIVVG